jgi:hypothetical protein
MDSIAKRHGVAIGAKIAKRAAAHKRTSSAARSLIPVNRQPSTVN